MLIWIPLKQVYTLIDRAKYLWHIKIFSITYFLHLPYIYIILRDLYFYDTGKIDFYLPFFLPLSADTRAVDRDFFPRKKKNLKVRRLGRIHWWCCWFYFIFINTKDFGFFCSSASMHLRPDLRSLHEIFVRRIF